MIKLVSNSQEETIEYGKRFSRTLKDRDVVILEGALGGGKTTFIKGVLKGLGYKRRVLSPSFTLVRQYNIGKKCIYHIDLYRLKQNEIFDLGIEEVLYCKGAIGLIEWGDKIKESLDKYIKIEFLFLGENRRKIIFSNVGNGRDRSLHIRHTTDENNEFIGN